MTHPAISLQTAIYNVLSSDADLLALLGGTYIFDDVPNKQKPPYIVFAEAVHSDWSTGTEPGTEHTLVLNVWSDAEGRKQVLEFCAAIDVALEALPETSNGFAIVNFTHEFTEVSRDEETDYFLAKANYRAVTEPLAAIPE